MEVSDNFADLKEIPKAEFIEKFKVHEFDRTNYNEDLDSYALGTIIPGLEIDDTMNYFKGSLNQNGIENLILPYHTDRTNLVRSWGLQLNKVLNKNKSKAHLSNLKCISKILEMKETIFDPKLDKCK